MTAGVYNNAGSVIENVRGPYPISISFSPTVSAVGTTSSSTTGGSYTFSGITLASSGTYVITVSSSGITSADTTSFTVSNYVSSITLASSNTSPSVNFAHTITATLKSADGLTYTGSCTITLSATNIAGTVTGTNNLGTITFSIYFTVAGTVTITANAPAYNGYSAVSSTISENIQSMLLKITTFTAVSFNQPTTSLTIFSVTVGVYDSTGASLESLRGPYSISLSLSPSGTFSASVSGTTSGGTLTLSSLRILSAGTYTLTASSSTITSATSGSFTVANYVYSMTLSVPSSSPSVNFSFTVTATLKGEDSAAYTGACSLTLASTGVAGTLTASNSAGTATFSIYFPTIGTKTITVTAPISGSYPAVTATASITILTQILKVTSFTAVIFIQPANSLVSFSINVGVYDNAGVTVETLRGPYSIALSISPSGSFFGTTTLNTASGVASFTGLRILSAGTLSIVATSSSISQTSTSSFSHINYAYTVTLATSTSTPSVNFDFTITATLKGEDNNIFTGTCSASLTETSSQTVYGTTTGSNTSGTLTFSIYLSTVGSKTIRVTCAAFQSSPAVYGDIGITVLTLILKVTSVNPVVRFI